MSNNNLFSKWWFWIFVLMPVFFILIFIYLISVKNDVKPTAGNNPTTLSIPNDVIDAYDSANKKWYYSPSTGMYYDTLTGVSRSTID